MRKGSSGVALVQKRWTSGCSLPSSPADLRKELLSRQPDGWLPVSHRNVAPARWERRFGITGARAGTWYYYTPGCSDIYIAVATARELLVSLTKVSAAIELASVAHGLPNATAAVRFVDGLLHASAMRTQYAILLSNTT